MKMINNKEEALKAVQQDGFKFLNLSEELKGDEDIILAVAKQGRIMYLDYASKNLMENKQFILKVVKVNGLVVKFASKELRGDKEVILEAVRQNGLALGHASEELKGDKEVVLEAVRNCAFALEYASEELRGDKEIVLEAIRKDAFALVHASEEIQGDKEVVLEAVRKSREAVMYASEELQNDPEVLTIVRGRRRTIREILNGIEPTESAINNIQNQMIEEQSKGTVKQTEEQGDEEQE